MIFTKYVTTEKNMYDLTENHLTPFCKLLFKVGTYFLLLLFPSLKEMEGTSIKDTSGLSLPHHTLHPLKGGWIWTLCFFYFHIFLAERTHILDFSICKNFTRAATTVGSPIIVQHCLCGFVSLTNFMFKYARWFIYITSFSFHQNLSKSLFSFYRWGKWRLSNWFIYLVFSN